MKALLEAKLKLGAGVRDIAVEAEKLDEGRLFRVEGQRILQLQAENRHRTAPGGQLGLHRSGHVDDERTAPPGQSLRANLQNFTAAHGDVLVKTCQCAAGAAR